MKAAPNIFTGLGLQYKFILLTTISIVLLTSIIGYMAVKREKDILYEEAERQGKLLGETLSIPIINDLIYEKLGLIEEGGLLDNYVMEIFNRRDVDLLYITILDVTGRVISHNNISEYGKVYSDPVTLNAMQSEETVIRPFSTKGHNALDFGVPILIGKKRWGALRFAISLQKVEQNIIATVKKIIILTLFFLVSGFVVIILLSRRFINPITHLASTMERTGAGFLDVKVDVKGHDELAVLGERFNSMIERIRQANEELRKTHEKLVQSEKLASIGILASGVAHEINNPLGGLFNCLQMLKQKGDNPEFRDKYMELIAEGLERIENTVNRLLWTARKGEHKAVNLRVRDAVNDVFSFLEYKVRKNKIQFSNEIDNGLSIVIDPHDFQQVALNLFINAIHAMQNGGSLKVSGYRTDSKAIIEVMDTGTGISHENLNKIFDPFFTTKPTGEGTGLGLWLTYEIIKNYNGDIYVQSEQGRGAKFIMSFPETEAV
ncbi:MAG: ATP-binding protein [Nitrospirota bacterium]